MLKLYAGGSQDKWDIEQLLALGTAAAIRRDLESRIPALPRRCLELWAEHFAD
jgi:hypothetical protein